MLNRYAPDDLLEAGCDEAGRGCLAGPVYAAAVILPADFSHPLLNDSKQMKEADRDLLRKVIEEESIAWAVAFSDHEEIDSLNILNASILAMHKAISALQTRPQLLLIDGNRFKPYPEIPHLCMVKGDSSFTSIAAASVLAKTHRDSYMYQLHRQFPCYGWDRNKAYATPAHREAIRVYGESPFHRKSFRLKPVQFKLDFKF